MLFGAQCLFKRPQQIGPSMRSQHMYAPRDLSAYSNKGRGYGRGQNVRQDHGLAQPWSLTVLPPIRAMALPWAWPVVPRESQRATAFQMLRRCQQPCADGVAECAGDHREGSGEGRLAALQGGDVHGKGNTHGRTPWPGHAARLPRKAPRSDVGGYPAPETLRPCQGLFIEVSA